MDILNTVKHTVIDYNLLQKEDSVLVALSGGPDSVVLLYLLNKLQKTYNLKLSAVYINHNIRPGAAKKEESICQAICDKFQIELFIISEDIPSMVKETKKGLEETARDFRYGVFEKLSGEYNFNKVALGHHFDDRVETVLFRIIRGTGRTGLVGIKPQRDNIIRPLFNVSKTEIISFLDENNISYNIDQSNRDVNFNRNFIRHKLLPYIRKNLNPAVDKALINLSETAYDEEIYLTSLTDKALKKTLRYSPGGKIELAISHIKNYDRWLRRRILRHCLAELSESRTTPDREVIERLENKCLKKMKTVSLPENLFAKTVDEILVIYKKRKINFSMTIEIGKTYYMNDLQYQIKTRRKNIKNVELSKIRRSLKVQMDYHKILSPLTIRTIKQGDRFSPLGLKGSKKIGDYLTDRKVDKIYREEVPVVCDKNGIIWLVGYEIDQQVKIDKMTKEVLEIELSRSKKY